MAVRKLFSGFRLLSEFMSSLSAWLSLINSGKSLGDKMAILKYFLVASFARVLPKTVQSKIKIFYFIRKDIVIDTDHGKFFCRRKTDDLLIAGKKDYEKYMQHVFNLDAGTFVDIGAHIGRYSIQIGKNKSINVISIEPDPENYKILKKNIELNRSRNILAFNFACYSKNKKSIVLYKGENPGLNSLLQKTSNRIIVKALTLDTLLARANVKSVDLIKIDTEDAEFEVLKGGKRTILSYKPTIIFECRDPEMFEKCRSYLKKFGYDIKLLQEHNYLATCK